MKQLEILDVLREKVDVIDSVKERLEELGIRFEQQVERLDQVQTKVDLSMTSLGEVHQ